MGIFEARLVMKAINEARETELVSLEDVYNMSIIPRTEEGYTVYGLQKGDLTIVVWVQIEDSAGFVVRRVNFVAW